MAKTNVKPVKKRNAYLRNWQLYLMVAPAVIYMLLFAYVWYPYCI